MPIRPRIWFMRSFMTSAMSGLSRARWYNPTSGVYTDITSGAYNLPNTGTHVFTSPGNNGTGYSDWALVLDRATLPAPARPSGGRQ
jgi:hypothetical protein